jgi:ABC-type polysaccharide/polyol phosphate transport system ATPase subunit
MMMRLMFVVTTSMQPGYCLIDEMSRNRDSAFQAKVHTRMKSLISSLKIFVFSSHSHEFLR